MNPPSPQEIRRMEPQTQEARRLVRPRAIGSVRAATSRPMNKRGKKKQLEDKSGSILRVKILIMNL